MSELIQLSGVATQAKPIPEPEKAPETANEELRDELAKGLLYLHTRANANTNKALEIASFSYALIELLSERGLISIEELDERKNIVNQRLVEKFVEKGMGVALTKDAPDKYDAQDTVQIDCENRVHLCKAACCRLRFALSVQDVEESIVKWDLGHPYMIRHNGDGYCHHFEQQTCGCGIYENRPVVCRSYDCRNDERIWVDFENRVINPDLESVFVQGGGNGLPPCLGGIEGGWFSPMGRESKTGGEPLTFFASMLFHKKNDMKNAGRFATQRRSRFTSRRFGLMRLCYRSLIERA